MNRLRLLGIGARSLATWLRLALCDAAPGPFFALEAVPDEERDAHLRTALDAWRRAWGRK